MRATAVYVGASGRPFSYPVLDGKIPTPTMISLSGEVCTLRLIHVEQDTDREARAEMAVIAA